MELATRRLRIVVLDDEPAPLAAVRAFIEFRFKSADIVTFTDAQDALQELDRQAPDLFTTDLRHPGQISGEEVLRRPAAKQVQYPVFVISAFADLACTGQLAKECAARGMEVALLSKPFVPEELWRLIALHVGPKRKSAAG